MSQTLEDHIRIMMADDHVSARQAYARAIEDEKKFKIIGHASNGVELLDLLQKNLPDIIILDLDMPVMGGLQALKIIREKYPPIRTLILSTHCEDFYISEVILLGANAYLPKNCSLEELISTLNEVHNKGYCFGPAISKLVVAASMDNKSYASSYKQLELTSRETDVLKHVCEEKTNKQIAEILQITVDTVDFHRKSIYRKTNTKSIVGLVKYAIKNGITGIN